MSGLWSFTRRLFGEVRRGFLCHFSFGGLRDRGECKKRLDSMERPNIY